MLNRLTGLTSVAPRVVDITVDVASIAMNTAIGADERPDVGPPTPVAVPLLGGSRLPAEHVGTSASERFSTAARSLRDEARAESSTGNASREGRRSSGPRGVDTLFSSSSGGEAA